MARLSRENFELVRQLQNERIRSRDERAASRREERAVQLKARLESRASYRLQVLEAAAVRQANLQIKQLQEVIIQFIKFMTYHIFIVIHLQLESNPEANILITLLMGIRDHFNYFIRYLLMQFKFKFWFV